MMRIAAVSGLALSIALFVTVPAGAVQYFYDDFNDGDISDWTQLTAMPGTDLFPDDPPDNTQQYDWAIRDAVVWGHYGYLGYGHDDLESKDTCRATKPLDAAITADTVYISWNQLHTGGYLDDGLLGWKSGWWGLINDAGRGLGFYIAIDKNEGTGQFELQQTSDGGETWSSAGGIGYNPPPNFVNNSFELQSYEVIWQRAGGPPSVTLKYEDVELGTFMLDTTLNNECKDPTKVVVAPHNNGPDEDISWPAPWHWEHIYVGDEPNPNSIPVLDKGDTNGDLYVDMAHNWREGDFNYNWAVDIEDLTALANNWTGAAPGEVPEPATMALFGLAGLALLRKKR